MNDGRIVSSDGLDLAPTDWEAAFAEEQVPWSHALQAHMADRVPYLLGPAARMTLTGDQLHPEARAALDRIGLADEIARNPNWSIAARAVELVHAVAEAIDIIDAYAPPDRPSEPWTAGPGTASWATEAPRGLLFHHYELDERGRIATAKIVPPTSQNQAAIEADLAMFAPSILAEPHDVATHRLEQLIRSYDPCISCATHFLDLTRGGRAMTGLLPDPTVRIIVCGNADRGDDGVALVTVATLLPTLPRGLLTMLEVRRSMELQVEDLVDLPADHGCLIIDAVAGVEPGQVVRMTLDELAERPAFTPRSSHQLPIDMVIGLAEILREGPVDGTFVGLGGHGFGYGTPLSRVVRAAIPAFAEAIETELYQLAFHMPRPVPTHGRGGVRCAAPRSARSSRSATASPSSTSTGSGGRRSRSWFPISSRASSCSSASARSSVG